MPVSDITNAAGAAADKLGATATVVTQPIMKSGARLTDQMVGAAQWYFEQWEDLVIEAKAMRVARTPDIGIDEIIAGLPVAKVESEVPGRIRLRLSLLKGQADLANRIAQTIGSAPGIRQVDASSRTGSILVNFDPARYGSRNSLLRALAGLSREESTTQ